MVSSGQLFKKSQSDLSLIKFKTITIEPRFLSRTSLFLLAVAILGLLASLLSFDSSNLNNWLILILLTGAVLVCGLAWFCVQKNKLNIAAWLLLITLVFANTFLFLTGSNASLLTTLCVYMLGAVLAMLTIGAKIAYAVIFWGNLTTLYLWLTNGIFIAKNNTTGVNKVGFDDLILLFVVQFITVWLVNYLVEKLIEANVASNNQAEQLAIALTDIEGKRQVGERVSQQLKSVTTELNATSNQQTSGSQQQASALTEIIISVGELSQTAASIAGSAQQIDLIAEQVLGSTNEVAEVTHAVILIGEAGQVAVQNTITINQKVSSFYQELVELLVDLYAQSGQIKEVINLLRQISGETHLLALNAAIEAAGAGEYGERFGVVATAVKELADRSISSSKEVNAILGNLQSKFQQAVARAEGGQKETKLAVNVAQETGGVIEQLVGVIKQNGEEVNRISEAMGRLNNLTQEITFATTQQSSASVQTVGILQELGVIAKQNAGASVQVNATVHELEEMAHELNLALAV